MHCEEALELISARMDGELAEEARRPLEEHLAHCAACRAAERDFLLLRDALADAVELTPPKELKQTVMANLPSRKKTKTILPLHWKRWGASAAAVVLVALAAWSLPDHIAVPDAANEEEYAVESYSDAPADIPAPASAEESSAAGAAAATNGTDAETPTVHTITPRIATQAPAKSEAPAQNARSTDTAEAEKADGGEISGEAAMGLYSARTLPADSANALPVYDESADAERSEALSGAASDTSSDETEGERSEVPAGYAEDGLNGVNLEDRAVIHQEPVLYHAILSLSAPYALEGAEEAVQENGDVWYLLPAEELDALVDALNAQEMVFSLVDSGEDISSEEPYALVIVTAE